MMRISWGAAANAIAWAVLIALAGGAAIMVTWLGPFGLVLLGLFTLLACTAIALDQDVPTWGADVFRARMDQARSPERRAAISAERHAALASLRFYRWCGLILVIAGVAGSAWQAWG